MSDTYFTGYAPTPAQVAAAGSIGYANAQGASRLAAWEIWCERNLWGWFSAPIVKAINDCRQDQGMGSPSRARSMTIRNWLPSLMQPRPQAYYHGRPPWQPVLKSNTRSYGMIHLRSADE